MRNEWIGPLVIVAWFGLIYLSVRWFLRKNASEIHGGAAVGKASWYGESYRGRPMANGQPFDPEAMTCAALSWPLGTMLRVEAIGSALVVYVEVTDRGPAAWTGCIVDLSSRAFRRIANPYDGRVLVRVSVVRLGAEPSETPAAAFTAVKLALVKP